MTNNNIHQLKPLDWVDKYGDYLYNYALTRLNNEIIAQDIIQETFLSALKSISRFKGKSNERTWLVAILKNKIIDHYRSTYKSQTVEFDEQLFCEKEDVFQTDGRWKGHWVGENGPIDWRINPEQALEQKDFYKALNKCMEELPERLGIVFKLYEMEEIPTEQICKDLDITSSNVWVILHRCRRQLRRCLEINWVGDEIHLKDSE